ncbi:MAG: alkaline phosphatase family protein [Pyrinomonadaceae bacterium]
MDDKAFERIFIIIFENEHRSAVLANDYMRGLAARGVNLSNYFGVAHPSQPNYIAAVAGLPFVKDDTCPSNLPQTNIVDLLEAKGVTWKAYMEDLPAGDKPKDKAVCKSQDGLYFRKHNPFISFNNVRNKPDRLSKIVNAKQLQIDIQNDELPRYSWYTPNIQNDGHSIPDDFKPNEHGRNVDFLAKYLEDFLEPLLKKPAFTKGTLVVIIFDESFQSHDNQVYAVLLGDMVEANSVQSEHYTHFSLLRTVEENFQLDTLGRMDLTARWFKFLWGLEPQVDKWENHVQ